MKENQRREFWRKFRDVTVIVVRNVFMLVHIVIIAVVGLLVAFGDTREGIVLGAILTVNIFLGLSQELNAWRILEKLTFLSALHSVRITSDGTDEQVVVEEIKKGDLLRLRLGDQVPSDGTVDSTKSLEVNEAMITGESASIPKRVGEILLGGSIVTSGEAVMKVDVSYADSRIVRMTKSVKTYSRNMSPIQKAIDVFVRYSGITLLASVIFMIVRENFIPETTLAIVKNAGALTSILLPQGLLTVVSLLFAYGTGRLYRKNVLLQEVNATEKLGLIRNLCMDKTGTLTESSPSVEAIQVPPSSRLSADDAKGLTVAYISGSGDSSQTIRSVSAFLKEATSAGTILASVAFSSDRQFGAVQVSYQGKKSVIVAGAPDILLPHLSSNAERAWLQVLLDENTPKGKRVFCIAETEAAAMPQSLDGIELSLVAVFILSNKLRPGIKSTIKFFQDRGIAIRIISGDNPETVKAIANAAGVLHTDAVITGSELETWTADDFETKAKDFTIFSRIKPEQKESIVEGLKHHGFTAMVGDGANDALAIKKADLGIAMFDGAPATRRIASVVLLKNSFTDFPDGVTLADRVIESVEVFSSLFFNQTFAGFLLFLVTIATGYEYPFTPLSVAFISYFIIVFPGSLIFFWILRSTQATLPASTKPFLRRTLLYPLLASLAEVATVVVLWILGMHYVKDTAPAMIALVGLIGVSFTFFLFAPMVYGGKTTLVQFFQMMLLGAIEIGILIILFHVPAVIGFFDVTAISLRTTMETIPFILACATVQYGLARILRKKIKA